MSHLRSSYRVGLSTDRSIELWWSFCEGACPTRQRQTLSITEVNEVPYFVVSAEVGVPREARAALVHRARVPFGALVEENDRFELRLTLPAQGLTLATLDRVLHAIAREAAQLAALSHQERPTAASASGW